MHTLPKLIDVRIRAYLMIIKRFKSQSIFDALNLFSKDTFNSIPKPNGTLDKFHQFKPSLISAVTKGPIQEQYNKEINDAKIIESLTQVKSVVTLTPGRIVPNEIPSPTNTNATPREFQRPGLGQLTDILSVSESLKGYGDYLNINDQEFISKINSLSQSQLVDVTELLKVSNQLTLNKLIYVLNHRNLRDPSLLPFDVQSVDLNLTDVERIKFKIMLMKKYHQLIKPLNIIKILQTNWTQILSFINSKFLSRYYERLAWKFYFEYNPGKEAEYIGYDDYHNFLIWESSPVTKQHLVAQKAKTFTGNPLNRLFFTICSDGELQSVLAGGHVQNQNHNQNQNQNQGEDILNSLKRISIYNKIWSLDKDSIKDKASIYMITTVLQDIIKKIIPLIDEPSSILTILEELDNYQMTLVDHQWTDRLELLSSYIK